MNKIIGIILIALTALAISSAGYCEKIDMAELVDQYKHATDLQRDELTKQFTGKRIAGSGIVENVGEYDFFDISNDTGGKYYKVLTRQQETASKAPYQVVFLYKDKDKVQGINRGEPIEKEGNIIKLEDERLQIAVWIYDGELTSRERDLFK